MLPKTRSLPRSLLVLDQDSSSTACQLTLIWEQLHSHIKVHLAQFLSQSFVTAIQPLSELLLPHNRNPAYHQCNFTFESVYCMGTVTHRYRHINDQGGVWGFSEVQGWQEAELQLVCQNYQEWTVAWWNEVVGGTGWGYMYCEEWGNISRRPDTVSIVISQRHCIYIDSKSGWVKEPKTENCI